MITLQCRLFSRHHSISDRLALYWPWRSYSPPSSCIWDNNYWNNRIWFDSYWMVSFCTERDFVHVSDKFEWQTYMHWFKFGERRQVALCVSCKFTRQTIWPSNKYIWLLIQVVNDQDPMAEFQHSERFEEGPTEGKNERRWKGMKTRTDW
jgi:hypothetical protein